LDLLHFTTILRYKIDQREERDDKYFTMIKTLCYVDR